MKVLHIGKSDIRGGAQQFAFDMVNHDRNSQLLVGKKFTDSPKVIEFPKVFGDRVFGTLDAITRAVGSTRTTRMLLGAQDEWNFTRKKLQLLPQYRDADIIHLHNIHGGYFDLEALEWIASEKKIVWTMHDMWAFTGGEIHTYGDTGFKTGVAATPFLHHYPLNKPLVDRRRHFLKLRKALYEKIGDRMVFVPACNWLENLFREAWVFNPSMEIRTIHNGIDTGVFKRSGMRDRGPLRILFFNSGIPLKGGSVFLESLSRLRGEFELWSVGKVMGGVASHVNLVHRDFIHDRYELAGLFNQVDVLVFPSLADTFPLTILEAMACGVCPVASSVGGIPEAIPDSSVGFRFRAGDRDELVTVLNELIKAPDVARRAGLAGSDFMAERFNFKAMFEQYQQVYSDLMKRNHGK